MILSMMSMIRCHQIIGFIAFIIIFDSTLIVESITTCYFGLSIAVGENKNPVRVDGAIMSCDGYCTNTTIANTMIIYGCNSNNVCLQFGLHESCDSNEAQNIRGCCCKSTDNCNYPGIAPTLSSPCEVFCSSIAF